MVLSKMWIYQKEGWSMIKLKGYKYIKTTENGNYKFTRKDSKGRNTPFYLSPIEYRKIKRHMKRIRKGKNYD